MSEKNTVWCVPWVGVRCHCGSPGLPGLTGWVGEPDQGRNLCSLVYTLPYLVGLSNRERNCTVVPWNTIRSWSTYMERVCTGTESISSYSHLHGTVVVEAAIRTTQRIWSDSSFVSICAHLTFNPFGRVNIQYVCARAASSDIYQGKLGDRWFWSYHSHADNKYVHVSESCYNEIWCQKKSSSDSLLELLHSTKFS